MLRKFLSLLDKKSIVFRWLLSYFVLIAVFMLSMGVSLGYYYNPFKNETLRTNEYRAQLPFPTLSVRRISEFAYNLFCRRHRGQNNIRAVSVRAINLQQDNVSVQTSLFFDMSRLDKELRAEDAIENIRDRYGHSAITYASLMGDIKVPANAAREIILPHSIVT